MPPLADRDGVAPSCVALPAGCGSATVLDFLTSRFPRVSPEEWLGRMQRGDVVDDRGRLVAASSTCDERRKIYYHRHVPGEPAVPFEEQLLYRDEHIAVVDKPHGLAVVPSGRHLRETLLARLKRRLGIDDIAPAHRIDRDTAGLVLFSLNPSSRAACHALFRERRVEKRYEAIAPFREDLPLPLTRQSRLAPARSSFMQMDEVPGEPNAVTRVELVEMRAGRARYELRPTTGQRHQLRVHLAALGIPIVNDRIYPVLQPDSAGDAEALAREYAAPLQLLAKKLAFADPVTGERRVFVSKRTLAL